MEALKLEPPVVKRSLPREVQRELVRFLTLIPLAQMDFRLPMVKQVTASDASTSGGGISASLGVTPYGHRAFNAFVRGEQPEPLDRVQVLSVGLFDGIAALRVACDILELPLVGHVSVECNEMAKRVVESLFPGCKHLDKVQDVTAKEVAAWACEFSSVGLILIGAGPPCQDVSRLNADRAGSQKGLRSSLYKEVPRIEQLCRTAFPWAQVHRILESVASMDSVDRAAMSADLEDIPLRVDSAGISLARRPRLYWCSWGLHPEPGLAMERKGEGWEEYMEVTLETEVKEADYLEAGWHLKPGCKLATFTTSRPSAKPGRRPAGLASCDEATLSRWREDEHRYPPYQYKADFCVHHPDGRVRPASISEREVVLGFPLGYTQYCVQKSERVGSRYDDIRKTLLGNSWSVPVVAVLIKQLMELLGVMEPLSIQTLCDRFTPGHGSSLASILQRPPIRRSPVEPPQEVNLAQRMAGLVSIKGEDLMLQGPTEALGKFQRFRQTVPSKAWKWREVAGWAWRGPPEHINQLELRAVLTTLKWLIGKKQMVNCRVLHLTDSMVVLHALSRGRSSSRKLRRTLMRVQALLLVSNLHPVWAYVHTSLNPADRPSRRVKQQKWRKVRSI